MKWKKYFLYFFVLNGPKTAVFQLKATFNPTGVPLESEIHQQAANQPITPTRKTMIIVTFKYLRNLPAHCESSKSLRNYNDSKLNIV